MLIFSRAGKIDCIISMVMILFTSASGDKWYLGRKGDIWENVFFLINHSAQIFMNICWDRSLGFLKKYWFHIDEASQFTRGERWGRGWSDAARVGIYNAVALVKFGSGVSGAISGQVSIFSWHYFWKRIIYRYIKLRWWIWRMKESEGCFWKVIWNMLMIFVIHKRESRKCSFVFLCWISFLCYVSPCHVRKS